MHTNLMNNMIHEGSNFVKTYKKVKVVLDFVGLCILTIHGNI